MTVKVQWDQDPEKTGLPDTGTDSKTYTPDQAGQHSVTVTSETDPSRTQTATFTIPQNGGGGGTVTPDKTEVDSSGDAAARTITVDGSGFPASQSGTVALHPGEPGSGGAAIVTANVTTDAQGAFTGAALEVPQGQADGTYHIVTTVGGTVNDNTSINISGGGGGDATLTADKTEVDSSGDAAERTITLEGAGFPASQTGTVALHPGEPGSGGSAVVSTDVTVDAEGAFTGATLEVPQGQADGTYHIVATVGGTVSDDTAINVTAGSEGGTLTVDKTEVDSSGDEAERTVSVTGAGLPASATGRVAIMTGAVGSGGTEVVGADVTADANGDLAATPLVVPADQEAGDYHIVGTFGGSTIDDNALTVTSGGAGAVLTADKTEVDSSGDEAARTVLVSGTDFPVSTAGRVAIMVGVPGSGGAEVVGADVTSDESGAVSQTALIVPADQEAGDYHIVGTFGEVTSDETALTVTSGGGGEATLTPDKTEVDSSGDVAERTITTTGAGFAASSSGHLALMDQADPPVEVVGADFTSDESGAMPSTALEVPSAQAAGTYTLTTSGDAGVAAPVEITVTAAAAQMDAPTNVAEGAVTDTTIPLTWDAVTTPVAAESYVVRHAPTGTTTWTERPAVTTPEDTIDGLTASTSYDIQVTAQAADHADSDWSTVLTVSTTA